jgi:hypothetical protein
MCERTTLAAERLNKPQAGMAWKPATPGTKPRIRLSLNKPETVAEETGIRQGLKTGDAWYKSTNPTVAE